MEFWLVVGLILGVVLAWAAISDREPLRHWKITGRSRSTVSACSPRPTAGSPRSASSGSRPSRSRRCARCTHIRSRSISAAG